MRGHGTGEFKGAGHRMDTLRFPGDASADTLWPDDPLDLGGFEYFAEVEAEANACHAPPGRDSFPDCSAGRGRTLTLPAAEHVEFSFPDVPNGRYAIALLHDENGNGKIDKALMIPREGFGFSRDAPLRMGPPSFKDAAFDVDAKGVNQSIRMRYII